MEVALGLFPLLGIFVGIYFEVVDRWREATLLAIWGLFAMAMLWAAGEYNTDPQNLILLKTTLMLVGLIPGILLAETSWFAPAEMTLVVPESPVRRTMPQPQRLQPSVLQEDVPPQGSNVRYLYLYRRAHDTIPDSSLSESL